MSQVRTPLAVLASDLHLRDRAPISRAETDWHAVQFGYVAQIKSLCNDFGAPLVVAGDVFDRWKVLPETLNQTISAFRDFKYGVFAVSGQHDQPHHRYGDLDKSSYWSLVTARVVYDLIPERWHTVSRGVDHYKGLRLYGQPWGTQLTPPEERDGDVVHLAVMHAYVWEEGTGYPGAPAACRVEKYRKLAAGFDCLHFGDNHKSLLASLRVGGRDVPVYNPGSMVRQNSDQRDHRPQVGVLYDDATVDRHYLDVSKDEWVDAPADPQGVPLNPDADGFLAALADVAAEGVDFGEAVKRLLDSRPAVGRRVRELVMRCMEE